MDEHGAFGIAMLNNKRVRLKQIQNRFNLP
jgi:hypothetical protein